MWPNLKRDFQRTREIKGWGFLRTLFEALVLDAGFQAVIAYRMAHVFKNWGVPVLPALCRRWSIAACGIDIVPTASIGGGCYIPHGVGIVIGGESKIGRDCTLLQGVTLGEARFSETACPTVGERVVLGAGAKLLGGITIGDDSFVAANAVVVGDIPADSLAIGTPAVAKPLDPAVKRATS